MKTETSVFDRLEGNREYAYSIIRIFLGLALFVRGLVLSSDPSKIIQLADAQQWYWWYSFVIVAHIIGGLLLALGLATRWASLLQTPILFGAVFFVHLHQGLLDKGQSLELSILVLVLLLIFSVFGSGTLSVEEYLKAKRDTRSLET